MVTTLLPKLGVRTSSPAAPVLSDDITRVKTEVDVLKLLPYDPDARPFSSYELRHCLAPDHRDDKMSLLCFSDGVRCQACGFKADAIDLYRMYHPDVGFAATVRALLDGDFQLDGEPVKVRPHRQLDPDLATTCHLALAERADALQTLDEMGFTLRAIRHFRLGLSPVLVRLTPEEATTVAGVEWRERDGQQVPYQWQERFAIPVFHDGVLRQMLYRTCEPGQLGTKIQMEYGAGAGWLFNRDALQGASYAVFCSGWGDAITLWQWGIPAVSGIAGDGHFREEWAALLGSVSHLYDVTDCDEAGRKLRDRLDTKLPWIRHIELPYAAGSKKDVRDFRLDGHTRDDFFALMKSADRQRTVSAFRRQFSRQ